MSIEELLEEIDATIVSSEMTLEMLSRLEAARAEFHRVAREKEVDERLLSMVCNI